MVVTLALESRELCTGQVILQPIPLKFDRLLVITVSELSSIIAALHLDCAGGADCQLRFRPASPVMRPVLWMVQVAPSPA